MAQVKLTKEEKKAKIAAYKAEKKRIALEAKQEEDKRIALEKAKSPEEKKAEKQEALKEAEQAKAKKKQEAEAKKKAKQDEKAHIASLSEEEKAKYLEEKKAAKKVNDRAQFAAYTKKHEQEVAKKRAELEERYDVGGEIYRFFFNLGQSKFCQGYMNWWRKLQIVHPVFAGWLYQIFFFIVFSEGVTIWQYIVLTFLPMALGLGLAGTEFMWPAIYMGTIEGKDLFWNILGYTIKTNATGAVEIGGGLGYFLAYEIAVFTAQCINFPLQRNITFKSHGNPWYQAMWYFIGWLAISLLCNAVNGLWIPVAQILMPAALYNILNMLVTGGISMVIFFFIFKIIFPSEGNSANKEKEDLK